MEILVTHTYHMYSDMQEKVSPLFQILQNKEQYHVT